jgi:hypothetical protein
MGKIDHRGYVLAGETAPCDQCKTPTDINLLDAKPGPRSPDDWERLECERCYGPGWLPMATIWRESVAAK